MNDHHSDHHHDNHSHDDEDTKAQMPLFVRIVGGIMLLAFLITSFWLAF